MSSIKEHIDLIKHIPVEKQISLIKRKNWLKDDEHLHDRFQDINNQEKILKHLKSIFSKNDEILISRSDIFDEQNLEKKILKTLMWGYPSGGQGSLSKNIFCNLSIIKEKLNKYKNKNIPEDSEDQDTNFKELLVIPGLGFSTLSKILYFFQVTINDNPCLIYDRQVLLSLNKNTIDEFDIGHSWKQNYDDYCSYLEKVNDLSKKHNVTNAQIEFFLFYTNLHFKLD